MADYRVTFTYADAPRGTLAISADTVGLAIIKAADANQGKHRPTHVAVMVLHKPPRKQQEWLECHVSQAVLELIPGLPSKALA